MYPNNDNEQQQPAGIDLSQLSDEQKEALLNQLKADKQNSRQQKREAYEGLRRDFLDNVEKKVTEVTDTVTAFKGWLDDEVKAFVDVLKEYGKLKTDDQQSFTITGDGFRLEVNSNKVKGFDERADVAADRLIDFLNAYIDTKDTGKDDPMYQLAMTLLERNKQGDLDYKSISKLYELEDKFGSAEYSEIMSLFKESNVVQRTSLNYYFYQLNPATNVWERIEPSFCRL